MRTELRIVVTTSTDDKSGAAGAQTSCAAAEPWLQFVQDIAGEPSAPDHRAGKDSILVTSPRQPHPWHKENPLAGGHVPRAMKDQLDALSRASGVTRSKLIERALRLLFEQLDHEKDTQS